MKDILHRTCDSELDALFVCVENSGRSKMAGAFARKYGLRAESAGTIPAADVNPLVVTAMAEVGIDISKSKPRLLTIDMIERAKLVITMGCSVEGVCPRPMLLKMQKKVIGWNLDDPKGKPLAEIRRIRDEIEKRVVGLSHSLRASRHVQP